MAPPSLLDMPYEIRQSILRYAVHEEGTIGIQSPSWGGLEHFAQPLFQVCRLLRDEALEAFYETRHFVWMVNVEEPTYSDPCNYARTTTSSSPGTMTPPIDDSAANTDERALEPAGAVESTAPPNRHHHHPGPLTPALPWKYPGLLFRLRHLHLNIYLPAAAAQVPALHRHLDGLVAALDRGRRLAALHVLVTTKSFTKAIPLPDAELRALEALAAMEVRGAVHVLWRSSPRAIGLSVRRLDLARRMRREGS